MIKQQGWTYHKSRKLNQENYNGRIHPESKNMVK